MDQTNLKESRPEMYQKFKDEADGIRFESSEGMRDFPALDAMIEKDLYVCPIKPTPGDAAYYSVSKDEIIIPEKKQFIDGESFYSNLLHEMSHASGSANRLNRLTPGSSFGSEAYAKDSGVQQQGGAACCGSAREPGYCREAGSEGRAGGGGEGSRAAPILQIMFKGRK